jgi:hypothetical protein
MSVGHRRKQCEHEFGFTFATEVHSNETWFRFHTDFFSIVGRSIFNLNLTFQ